MSTFMSWLLHRGRTNGSSGEVTRTTSNLLLEEDAGQKRTASLAAEGGPGAGLTRRSSGPMLVDFEASAHRLSTLLEDLTPIDWTAALVTFVGTGITDPNR